MLGSLVLRRNVGPVVGLVLRTWGCHAIKINLRGIADYQVQRLKGFGDPISAQTLQSTTKSELV